MKRLRSLVFATGLVFAGGIVFAGAGNLQAKESTNEQKRIIDGVCIGSVSVGGMTEEEAEEAVNEYVNGIMDTTFTLVGAKGSIELTAQEMGVTTDVSQTVDEAMSVANSGSLIERYKAITDLKSSDIVLDMNLQVDKQATAQLIYNKRQKLDIPAVNNGLIRENGIFTYVQGQPGEEVDIVASVYAINDFLVNGWSEGNTEITLITQELEPKGSEEELAKVTDLMGSFSTNFSSSASGRAKNVKNGCAKINGTVIYPGDEFSVYLAVSPFTQENGYELAGSYLNGTTVESFGGGICQVSTTLYNAAILAELDISMRYNHSMIVNYVDPSGDAAIAGTYKDLRFINNYETPIYIEGYCSGGVITFNIYGEETRPSNRKVSFESETLSVIDPETEFHMSADQPAGYYHVDQSAHRGIKARLWKVVQVDGVEQSREVFNNSTYQASPKIVTVGIGGLSADQVTAIQNAINTKDEATVKAAVAASAQPQEPQTPPETTPSEPTTPEETPSEEPAIPEEPSSPEPTTPTEQVPTTP